jgi:hypothetical protein
VIERFPYLKLLCVNFADGLVDCEDSDCCQSRHCKKSPLCVTAPKPIDILLRKQPPAVTASFYERMKFLIEEGSLQSYAKQDAFNERYPPLRLPPTIDPPTFNQTVSG